MKVEQGKFYLDGRGAVIGPMRRLKHSGGEDVDTPYCLYMDDYDEVRYSVSGACKGGSRKLDLVREVKPGEDVAPMPPPEPKEYATVTAVGYEVMPKLALTIETDKCYLDGTGSVVKIVRYWPGPNHASGIYRFEGSHENGDTTYYNSEGICSLSEMKRNLVSLIPTAEAPQIKEYGNKPKPTFKEEVDGPAHYGGKDNPYETIKVMRNRLTPEEYIGALKFNVYKYNDRAGKKGSALVDHRKALFYQTELTRFLQERDDADALAGRI